jgi:hypothetical protein
MSLELRAVSRKHIVQYGRLYKLRRRCYQGNRVIRIVVPDLGSRPDPSSIEGQEHGRKSQVEGDLELSRAWFKGERSKAQPRKKRAPLASNASTETNTKLAIFLWLSL